LVAIDITAMEDFAETGVVAVDTRALVLTLAATGVVNAAVESNFKTNGYVNLTAAGAAALKACDYDAAGADVTAVANTGFGVRVRKE
jgi:carbamoylphosphate synthase small subunit